MPKPKLPEGEKKQLKQFLIEPETIRDLDKYIPKKKQSEFVRRCIQDALDKLKGTTIKDPEN